MLSRLVGLFVHCLHGDDNQGSWSGKDSIHYVKSKRIGCHCQSLPKLLDSGAKMEIYQLGC